MESNSRQEHWENIYRTKDLQDVSWFEPVPETSLDFLNQFNIPKDARIIDVGGGDSLLVDHLIDKGYTDITVLDISATSIAKAKNRLASKSDKVKWIVADSSEFAPHEKYDFWHDRASFHFLTRENDIEHYLETARKAISDTGILVLGTFSENGPRKCSGLEIVQYSEISMAERVSGFFEKIKCVDVDHITPFDTIQKFIFCSFRKMQLN